YKGGLKVHCNTFESNDYDIIVPELADYPPYTGGIPTVYTDGISSSLGSKEKPAGNSFINGNMMNILNRGQHINYYYYTNGTNESPSSVSIATTTLENVSLANACQSNFVGQNGMDVNLIWDVIIMMEDQINQGEFQLENLIDNGDTEVLEMAVILSNSSNALETYNDLISTSPYVSDEVLEALCDNEDFPLLMIRNILIANPQAAKKPNVMEALYNRVNQLSQADIEDIEDGIYLVSAKEFLEANISELHMKREILIQDLARVVELDSLYDTFPHDLNAIYSKTQTLTGRYCQAEYFLWNEDTINFNLVLDSIDMFFGTSILSSEVLQENHNGFLLYTNIIKKSILNNTHWFDISVSDFTELESISSKQYHYSGARFMPVQNILGELPSGLDYPFDYFPTCPMPVVINPITPHNSYRVNEETKNRINDERKEVFKIHPNPAKDYLILTLKLNKAYNDLNYDIIGNDGKIIISGKIDHLQRGVVIETRKLLTGTYTIRLVGDGNILGAKKFVLAQY
ncbi:MAG: hypothetical protein LAT54_10640, partial [Cryomorphaceae bacterium]|nr:hypothetical protein [Cryomorphaceae bacterium]